MATATRVPSRPEPSAEELSELVERLTRRILKRMKDLGAVPEGVVDK